MNTIVEALKAILAVIGISVLLFNPSFLAAATKGGPPHQSKVVVRKVSVPLPPSEPSTPQKPVKRPRPKIKSPGKPAITSAQKPKRTPKPSVEPHQTRPVNTHTKPTAQKPRLAPKPSVKPQLTRPVNTQNKPTAQKPRLVTKPPVKPPIKRSSNKTESGAGLQGKVSLKPLVHNQRKGSSRGAQGAATSKIATRRVGTATSSGVSGNTPRPTELRGTLSDAKILRNQDVHRQKIKSIFRKPKIFVPPSELAKVVGETGKPTVPRTSDSGLVGSIAPKLDSEAASQAQPIYQQSQKPRKNIRLRQDSLVQTVSITDNANRDLQAALAEVRIDESGWEGKVETILNEGLQIEVDITNGDKPDIEGMIADNDDPRIPDINDSNPGSVDNDIAVAESMTAGFSDTFLDRFHLSEHSKLGDQNNSTEGWYTPLGGRDSLQGPGDKEIGDKIDIRNPRDGDPGPDDFKRAAGQRTVSDLSPEDKARSNDPNIAGSDTGEGSDGDVTSSIDEEGIVWPDDMSDDDSSGDSDQGGATDSGGSGAGIAYSAGKELGMWIGVAAALTGSTPLGMWAGTVVIAGTAMAAKLEGEYQLGIPTTKPHIWMPNPEDDSRGQGRDEGSLKEMEEKINKHNGRGTIGQPIEGEFGPIPGNVDPNAPMERAKQQRDWAILWDSGENDAGIGRRPDSYTLDKGKTFPDPVDPDLQ